MSRTVLKYCIWIFSVMILSTCKKFPEDKFVSLRTVKLRLEGKWKLEKIKFKGKDIKTLYNDSLTPFQISDQIWLISFNNETTKNRSSSYYDKYDQLGAFIPNATSDYNAGVKFIISKKNILFSNSPYVAGLKKLNKVFLEESNFEIRKLYGKVFKISNNLFEIEFNKIN